MLLTIDNLEKTFGQRTIFDKASLTLYPGERVGLIGANGSGKTTLFRIVTGAIEPDYGTIALAKGTRIGYLVQDPVFNPDNTVLDEAEEAFADLRRLHHEMRALEHKLGDVVGEEQDRVLRRYQAVQHEFELAGGYAFTHRLEATLLGVGLDRLTWDQQVSTLSGGQRSRLALARLLIGEPDLLLLDEPTNHLDLAAIEWLEDYLRDFKGAVLIISHDRFLLDRLSTRIAWLNKCRLDSFTGNYSAFVQQRELLELSQSRAYEQQQEMIAKQEEFIRRFQAGQRSKESRGRKTRLERFKKSDEMVAAVGKDHHIRLALNTDQRAGDQVLRVRQLSKAFGPRRLWEEISFDIQRGERIGMIGPNGSGKTTLLKCLIGEADADDGDLRWGANLNIGYYDQRLDEFDPELTVMEQVWEDRDVNEKQVRDICAVMLFRNDDIYKSMSLLSGGERARVRLAQLLIDKPNVLLLDEPTNHLDIASCEALERSLTDFPGTILCVSHDRYFLDKLVGRMIILQPPTIVDFLGNYSAWHRRQLQLAAETSAKATRTAVAKHKHAEPKPQPPKKPRKDNPYLRPFGKLGMKELEKKIQQTEAAIAAAQVRLSDPETFRSHTRAQEIQIEHDRLTAQMKELEKEYFSREEED